MYLVAFDIKTGTEYEKKNGDVNALLEQLGGQHVQGSVWLLKKNENNVNGLRQLIVSRCQLDELDKVLVAIVSGEIIY